MGWLGSIFSQGNEGADPLGKLDPKLREFLQKESPVKYKPHDEEVTAKEPTVAQPVPAQATDAAASESKVPAQSLYQDGRYAHLWKTYRSMGDVEAETKTDHEKLMDVLDGYKERKAQIGRAALENCALEQLDWNKCMKSGDWTSRMTMCRSEVRKFEKCYMTQSRLLKALGYLSSYGQPDVDERIQMHADTLYHRVLEQEEAIDKAKSEGRPIPSFAPLISKPAGSEDDIASSLLSEDRQKKWREQLEKLPESDRAAEEEAMKAELRAKAEIAAKVTSLWDEQKSRKTQGQSKETIGDRVTGFFSGKP